MKTRPIGDDLREAASRVNEAQAAFLATGEDSDRQELLQRLAYQDKLIDAGLNYFAAQGEADSLALREAQ
jgi:hypothetical protein